MTIRIATHDDMPILIEFARQLVAESRFAHFGFDAGKVENHFTALIDGAGIIFIACRHDEPIGAMACGKGHDWFSDVPLTFEYGVYVLPKYRGGTAGPSLIQHYLDWAKAIAPMVNINAGVTTRINEARTVGIYVRKGLHVTGTVVSNVE